MRWFSLIAIFFLVWFIALFVVLPFSARTTEEAGEKPEPGHAESAPHVFRPWQVIIRTSIISAIVTAAFYGVYRTGALDIDIPNSAMSRIP
jgi:predicted secreted protein